MAALLAFLLAGGIVLRITSEQSGFDRIVRKALGTTAGYDKSLINTVNRLERELATRASFGYQGRKDPMTGRVRQVVQSSVSYGQTHLQPDRTAVDPVRLTAIIFDDRNNRFTAVVMDGERSFSLEVGDRVRDRIIRKITADFIVMEGNSNYYMYNIAGKSTVSPK